MFYSIYDKQANQSNNLDLLVFLVIVFVKFYLIFLKCIKYVKLQNCIDYSFGICYYLFDTNVTNEKGAQNGELYRISMECQKGQHYGKLL